MKPALAFLRGGGPLRPSGGGASVRSSDGASAGASECSSEGSMKAVKATMKARKTRAAWGSAWSLVSGLAWGCLLALLLCTVPRPSYAAPPDRIEARAPDALLTGQIAYLIDDSRQLGLAEIRSSQKAAAFRAPKGPLRTLYDDHPYWIRVTLQHEGDRGDWVLAMSTTSLSEVEFFGPFDATGHALSEPVRTGLDQPWASRPLQSERYAFRVRLAAPGSYTAYLRVVSKTSQPLTLTAFDLPDHMAARQDKRLFDGITYGILLTLLVYNLALAASFRDRTYADYVLASAAALMTLVSFNGHGARYLFPHWPAAIEASYVIFPSLWILFGALFARSFLNLPQRAPVFARLNLLAMAGSVVALVYGLRGDITTAQRINELLSLGAMLTVFVAALLVLARGYRPAGWYIAGQVMLFTSVLSVVLVNWGHLDSPFMLASGLQIGVSAELVVFGIALSSRIRLLQHEQSRLETRAASLAKEARTDPLTGLANRTGLAMSAQDVLNLPGNHALLLLDLDRFKPVNDVHGHAAGDAVLVEVARRLLQSAREDHIVARLGGDEFVILLGDAPSRAALAEHTAGLQAALREPITIGPGQAVDIDSSIGVAMTPQDGRTLEQLLMAADTAMYGAKDAGRGRFLFHRAA